MAKGRLASTAVDWRPLWQAYSMNYDALVEQMAPLDEQQARRELLLCLLGGHAVTYELALSATERCQALCIFDPTWDLEGLRVRLEDELNRAQFEPPRIDGSLRRYRYPRRKATLIAAAVCWLRSHGRLTDSLAAIDDERQRRDFLCQCPGMGPKTASWLLRNLGYGKNVAVLDVHVLRAMATAGLIETVSLPRDYEAVEERYLAWCEEIEAPPAAFDLFLWQFQRGRLSVDA
jgi:N-glycosylase/DNA lyase